MKNTNVTSRAEAKSHGVTNSTKPTVPDLNAQRLIFGHVLTEAWDMLYENPGVTVGDLVLHLLAIADMDYDKASMVGSMVDAAISEHWAQEEEAE